MQGNVLKAGSSAVFQATSLGNFVDGEFTIELVFVGLLLLRFPVSLVFQISGYCSLLYRLERFKGISTTEKNRITTRDKLR